MKCLQAVDITVSVRPLRKPREILGSWMDVSAYFLALSGFTTEVKLMPVSVNSDQTSLKIWKSLQHIWLRNNCLVMLTSQIIGEPVGCYQPVTNYLCIVEPDFLSMHVLFCAFSTVQWIHEFVAGFKVFCGFNFCFKFSKFKIIKGKLDPRIQHISSHYYLHVRYISLCITQRVIVQRYCNYWYSALGRVSLVAVKLDMM